MSGGSAARERARASSRRLVSIGLLGDTLWALDSNMRRASLFALDGTLVATVSNAAPVVASGSWNVHIAALLPGGRAFGSASPGISSTASRDLEPVLLLTRSGTTIDTLGWVSGRNRYFLMFRDGAGVIGSQPFSDAGLVIPDPARSRVFVVDRSAATNPRSAAFTVRSISWTGDTLWTTALPYAPVPVSRDSADSFLARLLRGNTRSGFSEEEIRHNAFVPDYLTPVSSGAVGTDGRLWLRRDDRPDTPNTGSSGPRASSLLSQCRPVRRSWPLPTMWCGPSKRTSTMCPTSSAFVCTGTESVTGEVSCECHCVHRRGNAGDWPGRAGEMAEDAMPAHAITVAFIGLCVFVSGCHTTAEPEDVILRDSAGIRIVENAIPEWQVNGSGGWRLSDSPVLEIGEAIGDPHQELYSVSSVRRLDDGRMAISLGSGAEVRLFDAIGTFLFNIGRRGAGPGEFTTAGRIFSRSNGRISVWDHFNGQLSTFTRDGDFLESVLVPDGMAMTGGVLAGILPDQSVVFWLAARSRFWPEEGEYRAPEPLLRYDPVGETVDTLAMFNGREVYWLAVDDARYTHAVIFGRDSYAAVRSEDIVWGNADTFQLFVIEPNGNLTQIFRVDHEPISVTEADERRARRAIADRAVDEGNLRTRRRWQLASERVPARHELPAFGKVIVDDMDNLWIERSRFPWTQTKGWHVLDAEGRWLGDVEVPENLTIHQIGEDFILGTTTNEWDVPVVRMYEILKPAQAEFDHDQVN